MFFKRQQNESIPAQWLLLTSMSQLEEIIKESFESPIGIFKHSTRCSISSMAKSRVESVYSAENPKLYLLDLIALREISDEISSKFKIRHESPQLIMIKDGKVVYHASHAYINLAEAIKRL